MVIHNTILPDGRRSWQISKKLLIRVPMDGDESWLCNNDEPTVAFHGHWLMLVRNTHA